MKIIHHTGNVLHQNFNLLDKDNEILYLIRHENMLWDERKSKVANFFFILVLVFIKIIQLQILSVN